MRVLILSTPFDARAHLDGSRRAVADLASALVAQRIAAPTVLVAEGGTPPPGVQTFVVGPSRALDAALSAMLADVDVIHAWFAPRLVTATVLRAVRRVRGIGVVQTVASVPRSLTAIRSVLAGDRIVATSDATAIALATRGVDARRMVRIDAPFAHELAIIKEPAAPRDLLLYAGDWEFDDGIDRALTAFARMAPLRGLNPHLAIAARGKTARAAEVEARVRRRIGDTVALRDRVTILGEVPSLLPWIAAARGVLVPASTTYAKLDHPRVLLEAIALGVRIVVGTAPSLAELCDDPRIGEVARDPAELRGAMERCFEVEPPPASAIMKVLARRRPEAVAERYGEVYRRVITDRRR